MRGSESREDDPRTTGEETSRTVDGDLRLLETRGILRVRMVEDLIGWIVVLHIYYVGQGGNGGNPAGEMVIWVRKRKTE